MPSNKTVSPLSPTPTLCDERLPERPQLSEARRYLLLVIFCLAQLIDVFNNSALFSAIPKLIEALDMTESQSTWIISAYQLTFASFLLVSGRISDVYDPKSAFVIGFAGVGVLTLGTGFVRAKIALIVLRAVSGIFASLTIPAALTLIVRIFPEPTEQSRAIGLFGGCGAIGNVLGILIGAIFVQYTTWPWVFYFIALIAIPAAGLALILIPAQSPEEAGESKSFMARFKDLDLVGVSVLTVSLILLIFAVTSGSTSGWGSATVLAPLIISPFLIVAFFYYETLIPASKAAVPPATWFYHNFSPLFALALLPYFWWVTLFTIHTNHWQAVYHWAPISAGVHFLPVGIVAFAASLSGPLARVVSPKRIILPGLVLALIGTALMALASARDAYWPFLFPAFVLGSTGMALVYTHANIAIFRATPARAAGTVGAMFNGALQLGSAVGIAAVTSVEASVEKKSSEGFAGYEGRAAAFWFVFGLTALETLGVLVFYSEKEAPRPDDSDEVSSEAGTTKDDKTVSCDGAEQSMAGEKPDANV